MGLEGKETEDWAAEARDLIEKSAAVFAEVEPAVEQCVAAQRQFAADPGSLLRGPSKDGGGVKESEKAKARADRTRQLGRIIEAIRKAGETHAEWLAKLAVAETKKGVVEDKKAKNILCARKSPGLEDVNLKDAFLQSSEGASIVFHDPFGVLLSVTPMTNPTATVINNSITMLSGRNGVVFAPHPSATLCTSAAVALVNDAIVGAGGPPCLVVAVSPSTQEKTSHLLTHSRIAANVVTGGPKIVQKALNSGKKAFCAGPGNPPAIIDDTALEEDVAARMVMAGAAFDNNMVCSDEKSCIVVGDGKLDKVADYMCQAGAVLLTDDEAGRLIETIFQVGGGVPPPTTEVGGGKPPPTSVTNLERAIIPQFVGLNPWQLGEAIGKKDVPKECRLLIAKVDNKSPLLFSEQLTPFLPITACASLDAAFDLAARIENLRRHSASLHTNHLDRINSFAVKVPVTNFVVNAPIFAGLGHDGPGITSFSIAGATGEGYTTPATFTRQRRLIIKNALNFTS